MVPLVAEETSSTRIRVLGKFRTNGDVAMREAKRRLIPSPQDR